MDDHRMFEIKSRKSIVILSAVMLLLIVGYTVLVGFLFELTLATMAKNILIQFLTVFVPGYALNMLLIREHRSIAGMFGVSYALGYAINILEYFLFVPFGLRDYMWMLAAGVSFLAVCVLAKHVPQKIVFSAKEECWTAVLFLGYLLLNIWCYSASYLSPHITGSSSYSRDIQYWCNNSVALAIQYPAENAFALGTELTYHFFSSVHIAFQNIISGIDIFTLSFPLYSLTKAVLMFGSSVYLMDILETDGWKRFCGIVVLCVTTGMENLSMTTFVRQSLVGPFGLDIGFAYGILLVACLIQQWRRKKFSTPLLILTVIFNSVCMGAKAPIDLILIFIPAAMCLVWLWNKEYQKAFLYGGFILFSTLLIGWECVGMFDVMAKSSVSWELSLYSLDDIIVLDLGNRMFSAVASIFVKIIGSKPVLTVFTGVFCLLAIKQWGDAEDRSIIWEGLVMLPAILIGDVLYIFVNAGGDSEVYFMMALFIPMTVILICVYKMMEKLKPIYRNGLWMCNAVLMAVCVWLFMYEGRLNPDTLHMGAWKLAKQNYERLWHEDLRRSPVVVDSIQDGDVEALEWIRDNTNIDSILLTDRSVMGGSNSYYSYCIFAERQMYLEGIDMLEFVEGDWLKERMDRVRRVYEGSLEDLKQVKEEGVEYLIQTKWVTPDMPVQEGMELVYSSDTLNIYHLH